MGDRDEPRRVAVADDELAEEWVRETDEPDVRGVGASKWREPSEWPWRVTISATEFVREPPLEQELRRGIDAALRAVPGVENVAEEDREVWIVSGNPSGQALVTAAAIVIDELADRIRAHIESLG